MRVMAAGLMLLQASIGWAGTFVDGFDGGVDPSRWTTGADGGSTWELIDSRIVMTQGAAGFAALGFVEPITGDFSASVDFELLDWPAGNQERLVLNAWAGPSAQLLVERVSDRQYDPTRVGEVYLTDFTGQGILGTPTTDRSGSLRLQRTGDTVRGSFWDGTGWFVIGTYSAPGEGETVRTLGFGIFGGQTITPGVRVAFDNFRLDAASVVPEPPTALLLLAGWAWIAGRRRAR